MRFDYFDVPMGGRTMAESGMNEIPRLKIEGWGPGLQDYMPVRIVSEDNGNSFLSNVPLSRAKFIVACINECARQQATLNSLIKA
jgi:hypothetical protein